MKTIYKDYLFTKKILVAEKAALEEKAATENAAAIAEEDNSAVLCLLYSGLNMVIVKGGELATPDMVEYAFSQIGKKVPEAFYRGFPKSVLALPDYARYLDQVVHYAQTYGMGRFDDPGHSVFEEIGDRGEFIEEVPVRQFTIVPEDEAVEMLREAVGNLLRSSRPLNSFQFGLIENFIPEYGFKIEKIGSKNTAIKLLYALRDMSFTDFLMLSDVIKLVDEINGGVYGSERLNQLNLKNADRKFITAVIDTLFEKGKCDFRACSEKKAVWCGLLHHIHYKPKCDEAVNFVNLIRGDRNVSVYSGFEKALGQGDVRNAVLTLKEGKGGASVLRNLDYLASRCKNGEELDFVMNACPSDNLIVLLQLLQRYRNPYSTVNGPRVFRYVHRNTVRVHSETPEETVRRKSHITEGQKAGLSEHIENNIRRLLKGRLGKVYIDPEMRRAALPIQESASNGGAGVLAKGTRIPIAEAKKIRAFTYWEKVNDIDLSVIGLTEDGAQREFSWRTMAGENSDAITYSGDQTSGFKGGSEFFDVDVALFKAKYPEVRYLVFCDNVYSGTPFSGCVCRAGYMLRDTADSGEIFEPKTVQSSFTVTCDSTFAYLFGIDLKKREFVWLNESQNGTVTVAGTRHLNFLLTTFAATDVINMYTFFEMAATEVVSDPKEADVAVTDRQVELKDGAAQIRSCDFDKILAVMNR
ncbi:MAG: TerD family protein [Clostridia bacterium]|nr:TerD family protein [Clostridia bacterium]